jgi:5S rRNA maturation endonuclease (ribonuclease M5)
MKKLLNIIGASVILSSSAVVASCSLDPSAPIEINDAIDLQNFFNKLQNNRPELSSDYNVAFDGQNAKYIAALEEIFDQEQVVRTPFIQKLLKADFYDNDKSTIGYDIQKTGQVLGGGSLVRDGGHKVKPDVADKKLSDYFYEKVAKPDEKPVITTKSLTDDLTDTKLGELPDKSESTIKTALTNKNKNLNVSQITITDITDTGATVNVIKDSTVYDAGGSVPVTFTIANPDTSVDLNTIITDDKKDLGEIEAATEEAVKEALTKKIPDLKQEEVTIAVDTEANTATITPNKDSKVYKGDPVTVSFTIDAGDTTVALDTIITDPDLGAIATPDEAGVKEALTEKFANLDQNEITIKIGDDGLSATISAKDGSTVYSGSVEVTFKLLDTRKELKDVIKTIDLGRIVGNESATILEAINNVNSSSLTDTDVTIDAISDTGATVTPIEDSELVIGDPVTVSFTIDAGDTTVALDTIITDLNLGEITSLDVDSVKAALTKKFANLDQNEITITMGADGASTATIAANKDSTVYSGSVEVEFTVKKDTKPLNEVLTETKLGEIDKVDSDTILAAVETANANNDIDISQLEVVDSPTNEKATIKVKDGSEVYTAGGTVDVTYTVTPTTKDLSEDITTKILVNPLDNFEDKTILDAVKAENPELVEDEVEVVEGATDTAATIKVKDGSEVYIAGGTVDVTYTVTPTTKDLSEDITTKILVNPLDNFEDKTILDAVKAENPELEENEVEVVEGATDTAATIKVKDGSEVYTAGGTVDVTYTVTPTTKDLTEDITTKTLVNPLDNFEDKTILDAVKAENPELEENEVEVVEGATDTAATIKVKDGSEVYTAGGTVDVTFSVAAAPTMNYYSILNVHHLLADGPEYSYDDYTMTIMIGSEELLNLDNNGYVYIPFTILPE